MSLLSTILGGFLSDRIKRRKPFVIAGMIVLAVAIFLLAFVQIWAVVLVAAGILGFGVVVARSIPVHVSEVSGFV